jgi:magnesium chelatase family protein
VAAAGGHNLFLQGPPGTGKTMIARRLPSILPPLARDEAIEVTRIQSIAGVRGGGGLVTARPFRAPHHTISAAGLVGGANPPQPGEATLAHRGVLFLDELSEFARPSLEALRQPLEDGRVTIVRGQQVMEFPTRFMLVAASNPCPCGLGDERCRCTPADLARHRRRLSGPLLDRVDILMRVERPPSEALRKQSAPPSDTIRARVLAARERQERRLNGYAETCNAQLTSRQIREVGRITPSALRLLGELYDRHTLSARGHTRILRVARTVADLDGSDVVGPEHINVAASLRLDDAHSLAEAA